MKMRAFQRDNDQRKQAIAKLLSHPRNLLVTILMMNVIASILVQNFASELFTENQSWLLKVGVPLVISLLFGEIIPKTIALPNNERIARFVVPVVMRCHQILSPFRRLITHLTGAISRVMFFFLRQTRAISKEELQHVLQASEKLGVLNNDEAELISGYLLLQTLMIKDASRPREEVLYYDLRDPLSQLTYLFTDQECSHVPVCHEGFENIRGVMEARDFLLHRHQFHQPTDIVPYLRKPMYVPENTPVRILMRRFREEGLDLAVVVNEYGAISGIIAWEDIVEVIVGEIVDRRDQKRDYTPLSSDAMITTGKLELIEFNDIFDSNLSSIQHQVTVGGWLTEQLGEIPKSGTKLVKEGLLFHVLSSTPARIQRLYIRRLSSEKENHKTRLRGHA
jgi:CBS domain containing-hemolysin-like protein